MTWHDPTHTGGAIFVNKENLAFALPLIALCVAYAYFKLVPTNIALSIIGAAIVVYKAVSSVQTRAVEKKEEKIANLDENFLKELAADEMAKEEQQKKAAERKKQKAKSKATQRIAAQKKKDKKDAATAGADDDDDDTDLSTFVNKNRKTKKN